MRATLLDHKQVGQQPTSTVADWGNLTPNPGFRERKDTYRTGKFRNGPGQLPTPLQHSASGTGPRFRVKWPDIR